MSAASNGSEPSPIVLASGFEVLALPHPAGARTWIVIERESREAVAIDVHLDTVSETASRLMMDGIELKFIVDTHTHADFPSGAGELSDWVPATRVAHPSAGHRGVAMLPADGEGLELGSRVLLVRHAPGHTPDHLVLTTDDALFSGDSLFIGGVARTDFLGGDAGQLYDTLHALLPQLKDDALLLPGHDYQGRLTSTIGQERSGNPWLALTDRDEFIARLIENKPPRPANMDDLLRLNKEGVEIPPRITGKEAADKVQAGGGSSVIDLRTSVEVEVAHIPGSVHIPLEQLESRADEVRRVPAPRLLVCGTGPRADQAQRLLDSMGIKALSVVQGGLQAFEEAGGTLDAPQAGLTPARQARLAEALLTLSGVGLALAFTSWVPLLLCALAAANSIWAGLAPPSGITRLLVHMPWNKKHKEIAAIQQACAAGLPVPACAADAPTPACAAE